jgi:phi13 family phage major tail protein
MSETPTTTPTENDTENEEEQGYEVYSTIGLRDVVIAKLLTDEAGSTPTYDDVEPLVGAIDLDVSDNGGDPDVQDYDDHEGDVIYPSPDLRGTIEMADVPPAMLAKLMGHRVDKYGVVVHNEEDKPPYFAWGFKSEKTNGKDRYVWYYKGRCRQMPQDKHTTKPSNGKTPTRQTTKLQVTFIKLTSTGDARAFVDEDTEEFATQKATFFAAPYTPDFNE